MFFFFFLSLIQWPPECHFNDGCAQPCDFLVLRQTILSIIFLTIHFDPPSAMIHLTSHNIEPPCFLRFFNFSTYLAYFYLALPNSIRPELMPLRQTIARARTGH